jgi:hypothetical protein
MYLTCLSAPKDEGEFSIALGDREYIIKAESKNDATRWTEVCGAVAAAACLDHTGSRLHIVTVFCRA